jgi:hypothetical protein
VSGTRQRCDNVTLTVTFVDVSEEGDVAVQERTQTLGSQIVDRQPFSGDGGQSGNTLERVRLEDGRELIHKRVDPSDDWISRATGDNGRLPAIWRSGLIHRLPPAVDHTMVAVEENDDGWSVFMRDASERLIPRERRLDRAAVAHVLRSMAKAHDAYWGESQPDLCSIEDRYHLLSPRTIRREAELGKGAESLTKGWEQFAEKVPRSLADVIMPIVESPTLIADPLRTCEQTLIHGDLRMDNLGFTDDGIVLLDWGSMTGFAPPAVEFMWFLGFDALVFDCTRDEVVADFRAIYGDRVDDRAMDLAFIGGFVHLGCHLGLTLLGRSPTMARLGGDEATNRAGAEAELSWWIRQVDQALERSSPI